MRLAGALVFGGRLSFAEEGRRWVKRLSPPLEVLGKENIPQAGPCLVTFNHYTRPGFHSWWMGLAISAVLPAQVHWTMTSTLTFPDYWRTHTITPVTSWLLPRIARVFDMTPMPPMPPRPQDVTARAQAVRKILRYAVQHPRAILCLAPEGGDAPGGVLQMPPKGVGRFILHLAEMGFLIHPLGIYETHSHLQLRFGPAYHLHPLLTSTDSCNGLYDELLISKKDVDRKVARIVMSQIAALLPEHLQGEFSLFMASPNRRVPGNGR